MDSRIRRAQTALIGAVLLAALALLMLACGGDGSTEGTPTKQSEANAAPSPTEQGETSAPRFEESLCEFALPEGQQPEHARCGFLVVPEDRSEPEGRTIRLAVAVLKATGEPVADPVLYLSGGPGFPALEGAMRAFTADFARPLQAKRDLIFFDQRGTGRSQPGLHCPEVREEFIAMLAVPLTPEEEAALAADAILTCRVRLVQEGVNLAAYTSAASAADIDDLMRTLGYDEWNLYGLSYGTRLALTAMRDRPEGLRSVVLDSALPPQANVGAEIAVNFQRSFNLVLAACAADDACHAAFPELEQVATDLVAELNSSPVTVEVTDPSTGRTAQVVVTGDRLLAGAQQALYSTSLHPVIPLATYQIANGEYSLLSALVANVVFRFGGLADGMAQSVNCSERIPFLTPEIVSEAVEDVDSAIVGALGISMEDLERRLELCRAWGVNEPDAKEHEPVTSDISTLVLAGEYDPITPPSYGRLAAETLSQSYVVEFPVTGHGVIFARTPCAMAIVAAFLDDPQTQPDAGCTSQIEPPQFQLP